MCYLIITLNLPAESTNWDNYWERSLQN